MQAGTELTCSPFNIIVDDDRKPAACVVFNGVTGSLVHVRQVVGEALRHNRAAGLLRAEREFLAAKGILVSDPAAQRSELQRRYQAMASPASEPQFVVCLTNRCNLACNYCYQAQQSLPERHATEADLERIIRFILCAMSDPLRKSAVLKFYGGEPLLETRACQKLAHAVAAPLRASGKRLYLWLQTNGTLIDEETIPGFPAVDCVEITLDGNAERHDQIRATRNGKGSFARIMRSLAILDRQGCPVSLRINAHSAAEIEQALRELETHGVDRMAKLSFYDGQVSSDFLRHVEGDTCPGELAGPRQLAVIREIRAVIRKTIWWKKYQSFPLFYAHTGLCSFAVPGSFCIDGHGDLYLCVFQQGNPDFRVGTIQADGQAKFEPRYAAIMERTPFEHAECEVCSLLPRCWGGCFAKAYLRNGSFRDRFCGRLPEMVPASLKAQLREDSP